VIMPHAKACDDPTGWGGRIRRNISMLCSNALTRTGD
jgi:hypothetical protein